MMNIMDEAYEYYSLELQAKHKKKYEVLQYWNKICADIKELGIVKGDTVITAEKAKEIWTDELVTILVDIAVEPYLNRTERGKNRESFLKYYFEYGREIIMLQEYIEAVKTFEAKLRDILRDLSHVEVTLFKKRRAKKEINRFKDQIHNELEKEDDLLNHKSAWIQEEIRHIKGTLLGMKGKSADEHTNDEIEFLLERLAVTVKSKYFWMIKYMEHHFTVVNHVESERKSVSKEREGLVKIYSLFNQIRGYQNLSTKRYENPITFQSEVTSLLYELEKHFNHVS